MSTPHPTTANPVAKDPPSSSDRRSSFLASLLSINPSPVTPPRHNSLSSSTCSSAASVSQSLFSLGANTDQGPRSGSPASSIASPGALKLSPIDTSSPDSHQPSLSGSFSSLASSFGWPSSAGASGVHPISIPNNDSGSQMNDHSSTPALTGSSAPTRRTSIGAPSFRRAFELPNYSNLYTLNDDSENASANARRGRSGSLFSSFGVGDASKRTSGPPRRKLSPMGERMIRDHPF